MNVDQPVPPTTDPAQTPPPVDPSQEKPKKPPIPDEEKEAFKTLLDSFDQDDIATRLAVIRRVRKAREFWKGLQYLAWSEKEGAWKALATNVGDITGTDQNPYSYVTNIYQAYGLTFISTLSSNVPTVRFWPRKPSNQEDQATAKGASDLSELIEHNNKLEDQQVEGAFYIWTDGAVFGHTRWVTDAEQFGTTETPIMQPKPRTLRPGQLVCATCGYTEPAEVPPPPDAPPMPCPTCDQPLSAQNYQPPVTTIEPTQVGVQTTPNGQEVIDLLGLLEVRIPTYAKKLKDVPYLVWSVEVPKARVKALFPDIPDGQMSSTSSGSLDAQERQARIQLTSDNRTLTPNTYGDNLITFKRVWFRKWAFNGLADKDLVARLQAKYPDGVKVSFAGAEVADAENESLDKHWVYRSALPGDGMVKPAVGDSLISVQERYNTLCNIEVDTHEHCIPQTFVEEQAINFKVLEEQSNAPGLFVPTQSRAGLPIQSQFYTPPPGEVSPQLEAHRNELMGPVAQFLSGLFPALFGGESTGAGGDTASGYAMQRDQAMGRVGLIWRQMRLFYAELMEKSVNVGIQNRTDDVEMAVLGDAGQLDAKVIHLDQLSGHFYATPETDEDFPMSWTQRKNAIQALANNPNLAPLLNSPANMDALQKSTGDVGLEFPGAAARAQQYREIRDLVNSQPIQGPPDPMDPMQQPTMTSSVQVDPIMDDHQTHYATGQEWAASDEGQRVRKENPTAWQNVRLHIQDHYNILQQQQMQQAQAEAAQQKAPPEEKPSQPSPEEAAQAGQTAVQ